jgi:hypothetical protein
VRRYAEDARDIGNLVFPEIEKLGVAITHADDLDFKTLL